MTVKIIFIFLKEESNIMITWNNLDTLASFKELEKVERVNLVEAMTGESGAERVKNYSVPMAEGLTYNYAAKQVDDKVLAALAKLADEAQLAEKFEALYNGEVINTGEAGTFSDHASGTYRHHGGCISIHTSTGGGACRTNNLARFCRSRAYIIDGRICGIKGDFLSSCQSFAHPLMACISGCINGSCQQHLVSCMKGFCQFFCQWKGNMSSFHDQITSVLCRVT